MTIRILAALLALVSAPAFAQTPGAASGASASGQAASSRGSLATPIGHELSFGLGHYRYTEPDPPSISIQGVKLAAEYTGTMAFGASGRWFGQVNARGAAGRAAYNGWCSPFLITPNSASPNGYALGLGDRSPCDESGDQDWYVEGRGLVGRDFAGSRAALSPYIGLGLRHLSNGTTGTPGYRTDEYLYLPVGVTLRTSAGPERALSLTLEYDYLLRGWQTTRQSLLGGGRVPATSSAPAFTIDGFNDFAFRQDAGWGLGARARVPINRRWSIEPYYLYWHVNDSTTDYGLVTFTVNGVAARQQFGAYEPLNTTREAGVKLRLRF